MIIAKESDSYLVLIESNTEWFVSNYATDFILVLISSHNVFWLLLDQKILKRQKQNGSCVIVLLPNKPNFAWSLQMYVLI